jgi:stage II sporulation protein B
VGKKKRNIHMNKKRPKLRINDLDVNRKKDEQAATLESSNKPLGTFKRLVNHSKLSKIGQDKNILKPVMLAVISALIIGSLFGVIMLRMFVTMDSSPEMGGNTNPAAIGTEDAEKENTENISDQNAQIVEFEPITAYVLQAGIFTEIENAEDWAANYEAANIPTMVWQRDDQYFLFAGVANSAEEAAPAGEELGTEELEIYSKEWSTPLIEIALTANEEEWLNSYLTFWHQALSSAAEDINNQLEQLIESFPDDADQLSPLYDKLTEINEINDTVLLELWHIYETLDK